MINKLNDLNSKEFFLFTKSWFIFDALPSDLKEERLLLANCETHPATFSPTMAAEFIKFFTKAKQIVLDPFVGIGSTLVACDRTDRLGIGIELNEKYASIAKKRTPQKVIIGNALELDKMDLPEVDYCFTSPPYWNILSRSTKSFHADRKAKKLDLKYSNNPNDLGNIEEYADFLDSLVKILQLVANLLRKKAYLTVIVKNLKKGGKIYPLAWDLAQRLSQFLILKDEKLWCQDHAAMSPYGYPTAWVSNTLHHYCLNFRKE